MHVFKATIDSEIMKETIEAISALVTECRLHTDDNGISARAVDTANVAMISLTLGKQAFKSYEASPGEIGIDIAKIKNVFGMAGSKDSLSLLLPDTMQKLQISFGSYHYSVTLLDTNTIRKDPNPPSIQLPGKVVIAGADLYEAIKAASIVSDKISFRIDPEAQIFEMRADGDTDQIDKVFSKEDVKDIIFVKARSMFSLDYLKDMGKVMGKADLVEIYLGTDHPVRFSFPIAGGAGHVEYLLAPRIEAE